MSCRRQSITLVAAVFLLIGCNRETTEADPAPLPVTVWRLEVTDPATSQRLAGSVRSWKTEQISFEVAGRVEFVIEPETDVEGDLYGYRQEGVSESPERTSPLPITRGDELARIDPTRYELTVASIQAQIASATAQRDATVIERDQVIPAQLVAAEADLGLATADLDRHRELLQSGSVTQAEYDRIEANYNAATATLTQTQAQRLAKDAEVASLDARIDELQEDLSQAQRDIAECSLYAPFRGQVSAVHVIPGAFVERGQAVVTVQMMSPIQITLEVSAETTRRLKYRDRINVFVPTRTGGPSSSAIDTAAGDPGIRREGLVYMIDPVADPDTRTFTVTLLVDNEKITADLEQVDGAEALPRTEDVWRILEAPYVEPGALFIEQHSVFSDPQGDFLLRITNWDAFNSRNDPVLEVERFAVEAGELHVPWLGLWTFRQITLPAGSSPDLDQALFIGQLTNAEAESAVRRVVFDREQWLLRPGDLVRVDLNAAATGPGFFVPVSAVHVRGGQSYVVQAVPDGEGHVARRVPVRLDEGPGAYRRIAASDEGESLEPGMLLVQRGVHYVQDGEALQILRDTAD